MFQFCSGSCFLSEVVQRGGKGSKGFWDEGCCWWWIGDGGGVGDVALRTTGGRGYRAVHGVGVGGQQYQKK